MNSSSYYKWHFASRYNLITVLELDNKFLCNEDPHAYKHPFVLRAVQLLRIITENITKLNFWTFTQFQQVWAKYFIWNNKKKLVSELKCLEDLVKNICFCGQKLSLAHARRIKCSIYQMISCVLKG